MDAALHRSFFVFFFLFVSTFVSAQSGYRLLDIIHGPGSQEVRLDQLTADQHGGSADFTIFYPSTTCTERYRFEWSFLQEIQQIPAGGEIDIVQSAKMKGIGCDPRSGVMWVEGSSGSSFLAQQRRIARCDGFRLLTRESRIVPEPGDYQRSAERARLMLQPGCDYVYFTLKFQLPDGQMTPYYEIAYLFQAQTASRPAITGYDSSNSPVGQQGQAMHTESVYELGVQMGLLELGAYYNWEQATLLNQFDKAIQAASRSGCVSPGALESLRRRLQTVDQPNVLYADIKTLRESMSQEIGKNCK